MQKILLSLFIISLSWPFMANANKVYKWTDENGQVHFSSHPPRSLDKDVYNVRVDKAADAPPAKPATVAKPAPAAKEEKAAISNEQATKYCQQAKDAKAKLSENFSRRFKQDDGSFRPLTDKERADMMKSANEAITAYCK
jgi:hypothetical protein